MNRRRTTVTATIGVAAAAALGCSAHALAAPAHGRPAPTTYRYVATVDETSGLNDQGVPGGLGRRGTLHAVLHGPGHPHGAVVGGVELELQTTSTRYPSTILETGTIQLPGGVLAVQGVQSEDVSDAPLAITGGTGRYVARTGTVDISDDGVVSVHFVCRRSG